MTGVFIFIGVGATIILSGLLTQGILWFHKHYEISWGKDFIDENI